MATLVQDRRVERFPVYYGWVVWAVGTLGLIAAGPAAGFTVSMFYDHFIEDFNLSRTAISTLLGVGTFFGALGLTWIGKQIDRHGSRRVGTTVATGYTLVLISLSVIIAGPVSLFIGFFALRFLGQGAMMLVSNTAISKWWQMRRGRVVSLSLVAVALYQTTYLRVLYDLIETYGWRTTWVILGVAVGAITIPLWYFFMRATPENYGLEADGKFDPMHDNVRLVNPDVVTNDNWTLAEAKRTPIFWVFMLGRMMSSMLGGGLVIHQVSVFELRGFDALMVANIFGLMALLRAGLTLGAGQYINRVKPGYVMALQASLMIIVMFMGMTMYNGFTLGIYTLAFAIVFSLGATFEGSVWANLYGRKYHGEIRGFVTTTLIIGTSLGPILYGFSFDIAGNYAPIFIAGMIGSLCTLTLALFVPMPKKRNS